MTTAPLDIDKRIIAVTPLILSLRLTDMPHHLQPAFVALRNDLMKKQGDNGDSERLASGIMHLYVELL